MGTNTSSFSGGLRKEFMVEGVSAGGNFAAVLALKARDDPSLKRKLPGQVLQVHILCFTPFLSRETKKYRPLCTFLRSLDRWKPGLLLTEQNKSVPILTPTQLPEVYGMGGITCRHYHWKYTRLLLAVEDIMIYVAASYIERST
ncbi:hypothetical protein K439DRAFT_110781 [Ramaria rubella]|nr:hypothetical protein K439DRAFT_110781 [Ramaria rubella]